MTNERVYNEDFYGSLAQWQTLNPAPPPANFYFGFDKLFWHPYMDLPRLPLDERFASFCTRLEAVRTKH